MGWDDDAFAVDLFSDPTVDCFGETFEDTDPFQDSFGGDKEWSAFNDDDEQDDNLAERQQHQHRRRRQQREVSPTKDGRHEKKSLDGGSEHRRRSGRSSTTSSTSRDKLSSSGHQPRHRAKSSSSGQSRKPPTSPRKSLKGSHSNPLSLDKFMAGASNDDPFNVGLEASSVSSPSNDGFADSSSRNKKRIPREDGFGHFSNNFDTVSNPFVTETPNSTRGSLPPPRASHPAHHHRVIHRKSGKVERMTSIELRSRTRNSESRRNQVKDSLFSSLGDMDEVDDVGPGLSSFLSSESKGRARRRGSMGGESVGGHSTQSAPVGDRYQKTAAPRRGHRSSSTQPRSYDDADGPSLSSHPRRPGKSLKGRPPRRGSSLPSAADASSESGGQKVSLDIAELSKYGQLQVVDGKVQLVLDVEALAR